MPRSVDHPVSSTPFAIRVFAIAARPPRVHDEARGKVLTRARLDRHQAIFASVCADFEVELREFNGERDHVHLLVFYPPKVRLSELVNSLKGVSSRLLKKEFPEIASFWFAWKSRGVLWTPSYFAGSMGDAPLSILKQYIENQGR